MVSAAAAFLLASVGTTSYQLLYGLNRLGKWRTQESLTKVVLVLFFLALGGGDSLDRAVLALLTAHLAFFLLGVFWTRNHFTFHRSAFRFSSMVKHLRFGLLFFVSSLVMMALWKGGEVLILALSNSSSEVAYFSVANTIVLTFTASIAQLTYMLVPSLTALHVSGEKVRMELLMGHALKYLTVVCFGFLLGVYALAAWVVPTVLGDQYLPVVENLKVLGFALLPLGLIQLGQSSAVVRAQPAKALRVSLVALGAFLMGSVVLVPISGSYGACVAMVGAMICASLAAYFEYGLSAVVSVGRLWRVSFAGFAALALIPLPIDLGIPKGLAALVAYVPLLFLVGAVTLAELREIGHALVNRGEESTNREERMRPLG